MDPWYLSCGVRTFRELLPLRCIATLLVLSCYILRNVGVSAQGSSIQCNVPSVELHGKTQVTCSFPEDVQQTKRDFTVYLYSDKGSPEAVLDCWWLSGKLDCFVASGYKYDKTVSQRLSLEVPRVAAPQIGTYACQLASYGPDSIRTCDLKVRLEGRTVCEIPTVKKESETSLLCYFPEDLSKTRSDFSVYHYSSAGATDRVLSCRWEEGSLNCDTIRGYEFDKSVTDHLTLTIPRVSASQEGNYSCQITDAKSVRFENCSFTLEKEKTSSCNMPNVEEIEPTALTCIFSIDLNATRKDFKVVHLSGQGEQGTEILNCTWADNKLLCTTVPGYEFSSSVTNRVVVRIPKATREHNGTYTCHLKHSEFENAESCEFFLKTGASAPSDSGAIIAVTAAGVIIMCIPVTLIIVFFVCRNRQGTPSENAASDEEKPMLSELDRTIELLISLTEEFSKMYPDYNTKSYFVPSLYLNTNKHTTVNVAGEPVYITESPKEKIVKYHMAMQRVLNSLRHVAKHEKGMFVISQFSYDNYMSAVSESFANHKLPMPAALRKQDRYYGNFDVLIVHRDLGVLVGVVKAFSDDLPLEAAEDKELTLLDELKKACTQLDNAERMLKHLMSDRKGNICVHKTLFLPNLHQDRLKQILDIHRDAEEFQNLIAYHGASETSGVHKECLCAEILQDTTEPSHLTDWLYRQRPASGGEARANDEQYVAILARFCGPATKWGLKVPGEHKIHHQPTTLSDLVRMTGDLFNRPILQQEQLDVLNADDPLVFLTGPPASGKTRTLVLAGRRWLAEGHDVHVVSTWTGSQAASVMMCSELSRGSGDTRASTASGRVFFEDFSLEGKDVDKTIKEMSGMAVGGSLHIIADEAIHFDFTRTERSKFKAFVEGLKKQVEQLHLWASTCFPNVAPECCHVHVFTNTFTCPPTILLHPELMQIARECDVTTHNPDSRTTAPTEGPPLKFVHHGGRGHFKGQTFECRKCAEEVAAFLRTLHICNEDTCKSPMTLTCVSEHLQYNDVMVLFETNFSEKSGFCKELREQGITINILEKEDRKAVESVLKLTGNEVLVTKGKHVLGMKRKIVIYVEEDPKASKEMPVRWKRLRGLTSSTSQLIWVKVPQ